MKKIIISALFALFMFAFLSLCAHAEIEIRGLEDGKAYLADQYLNVSTFVGGEKTECTWTFSPDYAARYSSGKKIRLSNIENATEVTITAYHQKSGSVKTLTIFVVPEAKRINLFYDNKSVTNQTVFLDLGEGKTGLQLYSATSPSRANAAITWTSSDEKVATVDQNGYVSFHAIGKSSITASTVDGKTASVTVKASFAAKTLEIIAPEELAVGEKSSVIAVVTPNEAAADGVVFKSSKEKVISVSETGEITALRIGKAVISATTSSGLTREVTIESFLPVQTVQIRNSFSIKVGQSEQLLIRVLPKEAKYRSVTFVSLNPEIATVDKDGFVTGVAPGTVTIIASASNGVSAHVSLEIRPVKLESVTLSDHFATISVGLSAQIQPVFAPANTTERKMSYISSNPAIATVDENGVVSAAGEGKCIIYCQSERGDIPPLLFRLNVQRENALPLEGLVIGIDPGCQEIPNRSQLPLSPNSDKTEDAVSQSDKGVRTKNEEYKLTLDISLFLKEHLEKLGAQVVMTRTSNDVNINDIERAEILNKAGADLSISIHLNDSDDKKAAGFTARAKYSDLESQAIGQIVIENACRVSGAVMKKLSKSNNYIFLNWSGTPALLLECGYLSNAEEDVKLNSPVYQNLIAQGVAEGVYEYFTGMPIR